MIRLRVVLLLGGALLCGCREVVTREVGARILALDGPSYLDSFDRTRRSLALTSRWWSGETLQVGPAAELGVLLLPGALLDLNAQTEVSLDELQLGKDGNASAEAMHRRFRLRLTEGAITAVVLFEAEAAACVIQTPHGSLEFRVPTVCRIEVRPAGTRLICIRGEVHFKALHEETFSIISGGYVREWPSSAMDSLPVEEDSQALDEVEKCLVVERKLLGLQTRERSYSFPWRLLP